MVLPIMILGRLGVFSTRFRGARSDSHRPRDPLILHDFARIYARHLPLDLVSVSAAPFGSRGRNDAKRGSTQGNALLSWGEAEGPLPGQVYVTAQATCG
jgi:hypothetical protein